MNKVLGILVRTLLSIAILAGGIGGFLWLGTPEVAKQPGWPERPPVVRTFAAIDHADGISFDVDGLVVPYRQIQIAAQVAGRVVFKSDACRTGRSVQKDELLLRIDPQDYELEVRRLKEELVQADAMITELDAEILTSENQIEASRQQLAIDSRQLQRNRDLQRRNAASASEVDTARRAELATQTSLQSQIDQKNLLTKRRRRMEAAKALVQANLDKADLSLRRTEIRSPITGVVVSESIEQDGYVQTGSPMIVLQDTSRLDVSCKLHMRQMHWLWQSQSPDAPPNAADLGYDFPETAATVIYQLDGMQFAWEGLVDRYDGAGIDSITRMVPCRVHVSDPTKVRTPAEMASARGEKLVAFQQRDRQEGEDPGQEAGSTAEQVPESVDPSMADGLPTNVVSTNPPALMSGMFVKVRIHAKPPIPLVRLPQEAIQPGNKVWVVKDGTLQERSISVANSVTDYVVAYQQSGGLQAGDLVVTSPIANPVEGMKVMTPEQAARIPKPKPKRGGWGG